MNGLIASLIGSLINVGEIVLAIYIAYRLFFKTRIEVLEK